MISTDSRFHNVTTYLRRYTRERIGMVMGLATLAQVFEEDTMWISTGILEALGRLLGGGPVRLYIYPWKVAGGEEIRIAEDFAVAAPLQQLYLYLLQNGFIAGIDAAPGLDLATLPHEVLVKLHTGESSWEELVPREVVEIIKARQLFGYGGAGSAVGPAASR